MGSDEFELKFPELSRAERLSSRAGHFNFRAETELDFFLIHKAFLSLKTLDPKISNFKEKKYYLPKEKRVRMQVKLGTVRTPS